MSQYRKNKGGFTLVEILIVVIILGILAAVVIPQFTNASTDAKASSTKSQLQTLRSQIELYKLQHNDVVPDLVTSWTPFTAKSDATGATGTTTAYPFGPYLQVAPKNPQNGLTVVGAAASSTIGWVYNTSNGQLQAMGTGASVFAE